MYNNDNAILKYFNKYKEHDDEEFRFVVYPNVNKYDYVISNYGQIFNFLKEEKKKTHIDKDGYLATSIKMNFNGKKLHKNCFIHRLVAFTFCDLRPGCNVVNHLDGKKQNNYYKNLEWTTPGDNTRHALMTGLQCNSGPNCPSAIYSEETVRLICKMFEDGYDSLEIYRHITNHKKVTDKAVYALIHSIKTRHRHTSISSEYNIPSNVTSKLKPKFTKEEEKHLINLILSGKKTMEILKIYGITNINSPEGRRYSDKIRYIKNKKNKNK